jgi:type IV pilus assembly protein PilB
MATTKDDIPQIPRTADEDTRRGAAAPKTPAGGPRPFMTSFLEHLVRNRIISEDVAVQAAEWKKGNEKDKRSLIEILKEEFGLSQDVLHYQVAQFYAFRVIDINERGARRLLPTDVLKILRSLPDPIRQLAMRHKVLPYDLAENQPDKIIVVTPNPADREISDVARALPYKKFEICYMKERDWAEYWRQLTLEKDQPGSSALSAAETTEEETEEEFEEVIDRDISRGQLLALVENILADAVRVAATDIHVIPRPPRRTDVSFRIDGQLALWYSIEDTRPEAVLAVIKSRAASLDRFERLAVQEGVFQKSVDNQMVRFVLSVIPIVSREVGGRLESAVIRVQREPDPAPLDSIITEPYTLRVLRESLSRPRGLVLFAGPLGSGKGATVASALRAVAKPGLNLVTVEDPVETFLEGARQVKLTPKLSYEDAVRSITRHDPDIVYINDITDASIATAALRLAIGGVQVFATMTTQDSVVAVTRLIAMGVEPFLLSEGLSVVVTQRRLRKLCERCKEPVTRVSRDLVIKLGFTEDEASGTKFYRATGCINCTGGFKGRLLLHEAIDVTEPVQDALLWTGGRLRAGELREIGAAQGMVSLRRHGIELLKRGVTTLGEVAAAVA